MALKFLSGTTHDLYWEGATHLHSLPGSGIIAWMWINALATHRPALYYDRFDEVLGYADSGDPKTVVAWDPLVIDNSPAKARGANTLEQFRERTAVGYWNLETGVQNLYTAEDGTTVPILRRNPITFEVDNPDVYPALGAGEHRGSIGPTETGWYEDASGTLDERGQWVFFEDAGYALRTRSRVVIDNTGTTNGNVLARIDLATGFATPEFAVPVRYANSPAPFQEPAFAGDIFHLLYPQFVPDPDSSPTVPKGVLVLTSANRPGGLTGQQHTYVAIHEWNPEGVVGGNPNRVHGRRRLLTRLSYLYRTPYTTPGGVGSGYPPFGIGTNVIFHPPTRTFRMYTRDDSKSGSRTAIPDDMLNMLVWSVSPDLFALTPPSELRRVKTNARTNFAVEARGDLDEPVGGVDVTFTLERASTPDEAVGTGDGASGAVAGDFSLANAPLRLIEDVRSIEVGSPAVAYTPRDAAVGNTGVGNEVEVNLTNGDLQFFVAGVATDIPNGDDIVASYFHELAPASPSHGTLLTGSSRTDETGRAFAEVRIPDDPALEGERDLLTAST